MSLVLGLDFETTGLDIEKDRIVEVGAVLWDWERKTPLQILSQIVSNDSGIVSCEPAFKKHGITPEDIATHGLPLSQVLRQLLGLVALADVVMTHNGTKFDIPLLHNECERVGLTATLPQCVDTILDLPLDRNMVESTKLKYMAMDHGVMNPFAHRAIFDVLTMLKMASQYGLAEVMARAKAPKITLVSDEPYADGNPRNKASGFTWDSTFPPDYPKRTKSGAWVRHLIEADMHTVLPDLKYHRVGANGKAGSAVDSGEMDAF